MSSNPTNSSSSTPTKIDLNPASSKPSELQKEKGVTPAKKDDETTVSSKGEKLKDKDVEEFHQVEEGREMP